MKELTVTEAERGQRLDKFLKRKLSYAPMSFFYKMLRKKNIVLNGKKAAGSEKLETGDRIRLYLSEETLRKFRYGDNGTEAGTADSHRTFPVSGGNSRRKYAGSGRDSRRKSADSARKKSFREQETKQDTEREMQAFRAAYRKLSPQIQILFENDHLVIVNKPQGILSQKAESDDFSLNEWIAGYVICEEEAAQVSQEDIFLKLREFRPSVCHRLDRNTGGIVICAKTLTGSRIISELIRTHAIRKFYRMVVHGPVRNGGRITTLVSKDHKKNYVRVRPLSGADIVPAFDSGRASGHSDPSSSEGVLAETLYRPLQSGNNLSLVEAELRTGRSHQLRVHFAYIGHPIVGDPRYGDREKDRPLRTQYGVRAQLLHCARIEFPSDVPAPLQDLSGCEITCEPPDIFHRIMK